MQAQCVDGNCQVGAANWQPVQKLASIADAGVSKSVLVVGNVANHVANKSMAVAKIPMSMTKKAACKCCKSVRKVRCKIKHR